MNFIQTNIGYIALAVVVIAALTTIAVAYARYRRTNSTRIRQRFGPEYENAVREHGSERRAEAQLEDREKRIEKLSIRELAPIERDRFINQWNSLQMRFIDSPSGAVSEADDLVVLLMQARGYPMADFEQRAADISVDHPNAVQNYRAAHAIVVRLRTGNASTEDLRQALIHYRALFEEMAMAAAPEERKDVA